MGTLLISKIREEYPDRIMNTFSVIPSPKVYLGSFLLPQMCPKILYKQTSLSAVFLSADSLIHKCKIYIKGQISSQNVSFYISANSVVEVQNSGTYLPRITRLTCTYLIMTLVDHRSSFFVQQKQKITDKIVLKSKKGYESSSSVDSKNMMNTV